jgi:hypothetical protein
MAAIDQVAIRLHHALESGALPPEGRSVGQRLMTQLNRPTRIAVIGLAGSGKTNLVNMLLGANLMPDLDGVPAVELSFGDTARVQLTMADGTLRAGEGHLDPSRMPQGTMRACQSLPDPRLKEWSFVEVSLSPSSSGLVQLLDWMAKRSDIAIWCSQQFDDRERALWSNVPDHLKDHSFLALTRADRLHMKGELTSRIARLQPIVADEFLGLYPIATLQAAAARKAATQTNAALWQSSGGKAFFEGIRQQVDQARTADLDHAYMLLERYKVAQQPEQGTLRPDAAPDRPAAAEETRKPAPAAPAAAAVPGRKSNPDDVIRGALGVLQGCADELLAAPDIANSAATDRVLERCSAAAEDLVRLLSDADGDSPDLEALKDDAIEGEQMLMLLRLERGESAAEDSLTVLLQLKKEIAERVIR